MVCEKSRAQIRISPAALKAVVQIRSVILVLVNLKPARRRGLFFCLGRKKKEESTDRMRPVRTLFLFFLLISFAFASALAFAYQS